jgi:hypothetical protein
MPLGIVSNTDFEVERQNSDSQFEVINNYNPNDYKKSEIIEVNKDTENTNSEEPRALTPIITSAQITGRKSDIGNVPQSLRKILAEEAVMGGNKSAQQLMDGLGMNLSQPTLSTYKRGEVSPDIPTNDSKDLCDYINGRKNKIGKRALNRLNLALAHLDEAKLQGLEARELSGVAKDMAIIAEKMEPKQKEQEKVAPVQFIMMAPQINNEAHYETVVAKDNY